MRIIKGVIYLSLLSTLAFGQLVINEIHYNPSSTQGDDAVWEFLELYNAGADAVNLDNWIIGADDALTPASLTGVTIDSNGYVVVAYNGSSYSTLSCPVVDAGGYFGLGNGGKNLQLINSSGTVVDSVVYDDAAPWPIAPDGADDNSVSLELINPGLDNNSSSSWGASTTFGGSPGSQNSIYAEVNLENPQFGLLTMNPSSPNETEPVSICAVITDNGTVNSANVHYSVNGGAETTIALTPNYCGENTWGGIIPAQAEGSEVVFFLDATDNVANNAVSSNYSYQVFSSTNITNLADLRAGTEGESYTISSEVVLTWTQSYRGQKYIQDATAAILIDDYNGIITTAYEIGDGITGLTGTLGSYGNMLQFIPSEDPGAATSTGNIVVPQTVTLADLANNFETYEAQLVIVETVTFADGDGSTVFANGTEYAITDTSGSFTFRTTFYDVDYIGSLIPSTPIAVVGIANSRSEGNFVSARDFSDFSDMTVSPTFANESHTPDFVTSANEIEVSIDITPGDDTQTIVSANIMYGTDGSMLNASEMWLDNGVTWMGVIPAQAPNSFLEYEIIAVTNDGSEFDSYTYKLAIASAELDQIATIQANPVIGQTVTVEGVVTIGAGLLQTGLTKAYMQDASGHGINLFQYDELPLNRGDMIKVVGVVDIYTTTVEIKDFSYQLISTGNALPDPVVLSPADANLAQWEGTLIKIDGVITDTYSAGGGQNISITDGSDVTMIRIWESTGVDVTPLVIGSAWSFMGVESQYNDTFQMLVAYDEDVVSTSSIDVLDSRPERFALNPAYPNPFNPSTTLSWSLEETTEFSLRVLDVRGREVAQLASGTSNPGQFSMSWDASTLSSGVYFVQLTTPAEVSIQKVMLLK